jgi:hypothetical protein
MHCTGACNKKAAVEAACPIRGDDKRFGAATTLYGTVALPFLSSRAKPRDLQFSGPFLETLHSIFKKICHLACPGEPWDRSVA